MGVSEMTKVVIVLCTQDPGSPSMVITYSKKVWSCVEKEMLWRRFRHLSSLSQRGGAAMLCCLSVCLFSGPGGERPGGGGMN